MSVEVAWAETVTVVETLPNNTGSAADASRKVTHTNYNLSGSINAGSTPPATLNAQFLLTLSGGAGTIDLRALTGTNGASVDGNGLKVQLFRFKNTGANSMTLTPGASNGIDLFGASSSITVPPGASFLFNFNDASPDISGSDKTIDVAGTGSQAAQVTVVMG